MGLEGIKDTNFPTDSFTSLINRAGPLDQQEKLSNKRVQSDGANSCVGLLDWVNITYSTLLPFLTCPHL
jgi:hypothetical protein